MSQGLEQVESVTNHAAPAPLQPGPTPDIRRIAAIVNPIAGAGNRMAVLRDVADRLARRGCSFEVRLTDRPGAATNLARSVRDSVDAVVVVGGDGTVRDVIGGLFERPKPLLVIPGGTENLIAREVNAPRDPESIVDLLSNGHVASSDLGFVNNRPFLIVTGVGFDAEVVNRLGRIRRGHITQLDYFWPLWRTFWGHRYPVIKVVADGRLIYEGHGLAFVGLSREYASHLVVLPFAHRDRGIFDICVMPCTNSTGVLKHAARVAVRLHGRTPGAIHHQAESVEITSPECVPIEADGDSADTLPARFRLVRGGVQFLVKKPGPGPL